MVEQFGNGVEKQSSPKEVEPHAGERVKEWAKRLSEAALDHAVTGTFNDITITLEKGEHYPQDIEARWTRQMDDAREAYRSSREGIAAARASAEDIAKQQAQIDALTTQLDTLDFSDVKAVLEWCVAFQDPSDRTGTKRDKAKILTTFAAHGYVPSMNTGTAFDGNDGDNFAKYLIGQALDGINEIGAILSRCRFGRHQPKLV